MTYEVPLVRKNFLNLIQEDVIVFRSLNTQEFEIFLINARKIYDKKTTDYLAAGS